MLPFEVIKSCDEFFGVDWYVDWKSNLESCTDRQDFASFSSPWNQHRVYLKVSFQRILPFWTQKVVGLFKSQRYNPPDKRTLEILGGFPGRSWFWKESYLHDFCPLSPSQNEPENRPSKKEMSSSNHPFFRCEMVVFRQCTPVDSCCSFHLLFEAMIFHGKKQQTHNSTSQVPLQRGRKSPKGSWTVAVEPPGHHDFGCQKSNLFLNLHLKTLTGR